MKSLPRQKKIAEQISKWMILAYQASAVLAMVIVPLLALRFFQMPFLGVFVEHTLVTNGVGPEKPSDAWTLYQNFHNLEPDKTGFGYKLVSLAFVKPDGSTGPAIQPARFADIENFLSGHYPGESVQATFVSENNGPLKGKTFTYTVTLSSFPFSDQVRFFYLPYFIALIYLIVSLSVFGLRRSETAGRAFSVMASSVAIVTAGLLDLYTTNQLTYLWVLAVPLAGASLIHLGLVFPQEARIVLRYPFLRAVGYIIAIGLALSQFTTLFNTSEPIRYASLWLYSYVFTGIATLFFIATTLYRLFWSSSPVVRQQARTILIGTLAGFSWITYWLIRTSVVTMNFNPYWGFLPLAIFPATTGYTVLRYRLLRTEYLLSRSVLYSTLTLLAILGYTVISIGIGIIFVAFFDMPLQPDNPALIAATVFLSALLLNPVRMRLQETIDAAFFRSERAHQERIKAFTREMTNTVSLSDILNTLRKHISVSLLPSQLHIYIYDPLTDQYTATSDENNKITSDVHFSSSSPLPMTMRQEKFPIFIDENHIPETLNAERGRLALLNAQLFVPLPGRDHLIGWVALGERLSGENYASHDVAFLDALGSQAAVALERAQVLTNMERRVSEMNVLARVAQGINITLNFDDILELIYAQTTQIIPGADLHLTLYNKTGQYAYHAFCQEDNERITAKENVPLSPKTTLEQEIIHTRRSILAQDFLSQCQVMSVTPPNKGIYSWMGVPLNTGTETIGALSIASRDPSVAYTNGQIELLQSIADQAAGAIVKSRLLQETERRAEQLATLNVITRQLASTLEIQPLLENILQSAVNILHTEAGSLFLVDEQTDELIFKVTVGPVANNLAGQRLPAGTGFVGKAVNNRAPVIINNVSATTTWNPTPDKQTGFVTQSILAIPMEVKNRVIGVIEIINKKDGNPFTEEDQNLLSAFGGQAAVAIENARLYTLTDQELNARVEELSVMQRIDRELNASIESNRAIRITLEWALRQSKVEAGLIGLVEEHGVRMMTDAGYQHETEPFKEDYMPLEHPAVRDAIEIGQPQKIVSENPNPARIFLADGHSQMVLPIRRETKVIGFLLLESLRPSAFNENVIEFLNRLSDHAAIAISNAQLYAQVQRANIAKSEFVSFVAHELKNPMTSIKGWAELLAAGAVGPINENQANALSTIRGNTERMKTIVEDLNDNAKIEAGRLRLDFKAASVTDIIENVIRSTKRQIEEKKQTVEVTADADLPPIWADRTRIEQILVNLVSNSHKYTPESGHIRISATKTPNKWDPQGAPVVVHIFVQDNGIGLSPEDQKKIFQPFFRSEDDQARKSPGTGLGLNITKNLIEMQGGKIWFESEFRQGTTFHFTVPISEN